MCLQRRTSVLNSWFPYAKRILLLDFYFSKEVRRTQTCPKALAKFRVNINLIHMQRSPPLLLERDSFWRIFHVFCLDFYGALFMSAVCCSSLASSSMKLWLLLVSCCKLNVSIIYFVTQKQKLTALEL